jgi:carnitine-CoA ligase
MRLMLDNAAPHPFQGLDIAWLLATRAKTHRDYIFIVWAPLEGPALKVSYGEFLQRVQRIAGGLAARGVKPRDCVMIHMDNCLEALLSWYACAWLGAVAVTTNARAADDELQYYAEHCGAVGAITQAVFADRIAARCTGLKWQVVNELDFHTLENAAPLAQAAHGPLAPCSVQYTSGTTARPKAVLWSHANALWGARINASHEDLRQTDVHLVHLPLFHTNAQAYSVLACLWVACTAVVVPRFSASRFWSVSLEHRCTWASMIPFCVKALMANEVPVQHFYRLWGMGASAQSIEDRFGLKTLGWWGMTETITHGIVGSAHLPNVSLAIGRPAPEYEIAIVDNDHLPVRDSRPMMPGESGHLLIRGVRGLSLFQEYLGNAKATADSYDPDGWFRTGDKVNLLADGTIQFGDRDKDMLKVGGENVAASEIERVIMTVSGVQECAVVAKKHPMLDEVPVAFILPAPNAPTELVAQVQAACARQLADFKQPREVRLIDEFPRSTLEKIAKAQLRAMLT